MSSTINTPNRVTKNTAKAINHIITNSTFDNDFKSSMIKNDIFDHFSIFSVIFAIILKGIDIEKDQKERFIYGKI